MTDWELVETLGTEQEAALVVGFLASRGIEARVDSRVFHQEPVTFGRLGEVRVLVAREARDEALRALEERAAARATPEGELLPPDESDAKDGDAS